jgi:hypothetical protein
VFISRLLDSRYDDRTGKRICWIIFVVAPCMLIIMSSLFVQLMHTISRTNKELDLLDFVHCLIVIEVLGIARPTETKGSSNLEVF